MASVPSSWQPKSDGGDGLNRARFASSSQPTPDAALTSTGDRCKTSTKRHIVDEEGFITPHPIKHRQNAFKTNPCQSRFRDKLPPKQTQADTASSKIDQRGHKRRGPQREIRIGSLHSVKNPQTSSTKATATSSAGPQNTSDSSAPPPSSAPTPTTAASTNITKANPPSATPRRLPPQPATSHDPTPAEAADGYVLVDSHTPSSINAAADSPETNLCPTPKKSRPTIAFDGNNHLSWADEVIEEADQKEVASAAKTQPQKAPARRPQRRISRHDNGEDSQTGFSARFHTTSRLSRTHPRNRSSGPGSGPIPHHPLQSKKDQGGDDYDDDGWQQVDRRRERGSDREKGGGGGVVVERGRVGGSTGSVIISYVSRDGNRYVGGNIFAVLGRCVECL